MIKAVLIDIDNTVLDFDAFVKKTIEAGIEHFQITEYEPYMYDVFEEVNGKIWRQLERKEITFEQLEIERFQRFFDTIHVSFDGQVFEKYFRDSLYQSAIIEDGALEMVKYLFGKYDLYLASNGPYQQQKQRIELSGLMPYFKDAFISEEIGASKPSVLFFEEAEKRINLNREIPVKKAEMMIIGDSLTSDMLGGMQYGIHTCFYNKHKQEVTDKKVDYVIYSLDEVQNIM